MVAQLLTAPARLLHPLRRRATREAVCGRAPRSILVVCHGNMCRSPFAAGLLRRIFKTPGIRVDSAGFIGPGRPSPREAVAAAARRGVDLFGHRAKQVTADSVRAADLIVVMDSAQRREICDRFGRAERDVVILGDLDPQPIETRMIRDPVRQPPAVFAETYARIERCVRELAGAITTAGGDPSHAR